MNKFYSYFFPTDPATDFLKRLTVELSTVFFQGDLTERRTGSLSITHGGRLKLLDEHKTYPGFLHTPVDQPVFENVP